MKRLTQKDEQGNWSLRGVLWESLHEGQVITKELWERLYGALWKLMEYEDTGLSPGEVEDVNDFNKSQVGHLLKKLSEEQRKHRWIPVEERLPEEDERVILCTRYGNVKEGTYTERYGYAMRKGFFTEDHFEELCDVVAWMPLPRPYQEEVNPDEERRRLS